MTTERTCEHCRFWDRNYVRDGAACCHRRAPLTVPRVDMPLWRISSAFKLFLWWYLREHSNAKTADEQLEAFKLNDIENHDGDAQFTIWPITDESDWCGEWEAT